jgi:hypothetical protein
MGFLPSWRSVPPMCGLGRFTVFVVAFVVALTAVARAEQFVGGDAASAVYVAWTADEVGHPPGAGAARLARSAERGPDPSNAGLVQRERAGRRRQPRLPLFGAFGGSTWTGRVGRGVLTLDILGSDGVPHEMTLVAGSFQDFQRRVAALRGRAGAVGLQRARSMVQDYDAKGVDLKERAAKFPETVECSG